MLRNAILRGKSTFFRNFNNYKQSCNIFMKSVASTRYFSNVDNLLRRSFNETQLYSFFEYGNEYYIKITRNSSTADGLLIVIGITIKKDCDYQCFRSDYMGHENLHELLDSSPRVTYKAYYDSSHGGYLLTDICKIFENAVKAIQTNYDPSIPEWVSFNEKLIDNIRQRELIFELYFPESIEDGDMGLGIREKSLDKRIKENAEFGSLILSTNMVLMMDKCLQNVHKAKKFEGKALSLMEYWKSGYPSENFSFLMLFARMYKFVFRIGDNSNKKNKEIWALVEKRQLEILKLFYEAVKNNETNSTNSHTTDSGTDFLTMDVLVKHPRDYPRNLITDCTFMTNIPPTEEEEICRRIDYEIERWEYSKCDPAIESNVYVEFRRDCLEHKSFSGYFEYENCSPMGQLILEPIKIPIKFKSNEIFIQEKLALENIVNYKKSFDSEWDQWRKDNKPKSDDDKIEFAVYKERSKEAYAKIFSKYNSQIEEIIDSI